MGWPEFSMLISILVGLTSLANFIFARNHANLADLKEKKATASLLSERVNTLEVLQKNNKEEVSEVLKELRTLAKETRDSQNELKETLMNIDKNYIKHSTQFDLTVKEHDKRLNRVETGLKPS